MARLVKYKCPGANGHSAHSFEFLHHPSNEPAPRFCPTCGWDSGAETPEQAIVAPHVSDGRAKNMLKSAEQTYRGYEEATANNAIAAADLAGVPVSEMSSLKVTNFETSLREGDLAVKQPDNAVSHLIDAKPGLYGFQDRGQMVEQARSIHAGPDARAGAKASSMLNQFHAKNAHKIVSAGEKGRY